ncbi:hypothetical protein I7I48_05201 [Histoplasma ohiense]|nr:hypothetical protein I7I48_05201 [Histoplasma ohiense (nom. inval.)]
MDNQSLNQGNTRMTRLRTRAPKPQPPARVGEGPMGSRFHPTQPPAERRNLDDIHGAPGRSNPPDTAATETKSRKRSAAAAECDVPQRSGGAVIPASYSRGNTADPNHPDAAGCRPQTRNNDQCVLDFTIFDPDAPVTFPSDYYKIVDKESIDQKTPQEDKKVTQKLFPAGWQPGGSISNEMKESLLVKSASRGINADPEPPQFTTMIRERRINETPQPNKLLSESAKLHEAISGIELTCAVEAAKIQALEKLTAQQWSNLIMCHQRLIHHHHDLYVCTQYPTTWGDLFKLPVAHKMPPRMLHHGIYAFLEVMKSRLPESRNYMIQFLQHVYDLIQVLVESAPRFKNMWLECLGDLAAYRMSLESTFSEERITRAKQSTNWYYAAADENYGKGSLYHRLGNLVANNLGRKFFLYSRSLISTERCEKSKSGVESTFVMALQSINSRGPIDPGIPSWFVSAHALLLRGDSITKFIAYSQEFCALLRLRITQDNFKLNGDGMYLGVPNIAAMLQYGEEEGILRNMFIDSHKLSPEAKLQRAMQYWAKHSTDPPRNTPEDEIPAPAATFSTPLEKLSYSIYLTFFTLSTVLSHTHNDEIMPFVHIFLAFIWSLALVPDAMICVEREIPWRKITKFLNSLDQDYASILRLESTNFPIYDQTQYCQIPDDFSIRGQIWSQGIYPDNFFLDPLPKDDRGFDTVSSKYTRNERCLWYGYRLASCGRWIQLFTDEKTGDRDFRLTSLAEHLEATAKHPGVFKPTQRAIPSRSGISQPARKRKGS